MPDRNHILGVRIDASPQAASPMMRAALASLLASGGVTFDAFLYPYADSLLLSDIESGTHGDFFGTHALLWDISPDRLRDHFPADAPVEIAVLDCTASAVSRFLSSARYQCAGGEMFAGDFAALLCGTVAPWSIRERARCFCSFAEHLARTKGIEVRGTSGGSILLNIGDGVDIGFLPSLYESKTGGRAELL